VNVLLAASRSDHQHHPVAFRWLEEALAGCSHGQRFAVLPMVAAGFLRLVTHPRVFVELTQLAAAQEFLDALLAAEGVQLLPLSSECPLLEALCREHQLVGNAISDGWNAAAVLAHRKCQVTFIGILFLCCHLASRCC
jgi:predicted nucleic acid-binding protein